MVKAYLSGVFILIVGSWKHEVGRFWVRKIEKMRLPQRHEDTKVHKDLIINELSFVQLCALVP